MFLKDLLVTVAPQFMKTHGIGIPEGRKEKSMEWKGRKEKERG
jgi:hypothetical protein